MLKINFYKIQEDIPIRNAVKKLDEGAIGFIVCVNQNDEVTGILTDGDFRRAILRGINLQQQVSTIMNKNFYYLAFDYKEKEAKKIFKNTVANRIPVLQDKKLINIIMKEEFFKINGKEVTKKPQIELPVVIMAGGKGIRLDPFTRILPKALIPIGDKSIIEIIMDKFAEFGITNFYISVNYKSKMIKAFFEDFNSNYKISFIDENMPLGTAGALKYLEKRIDTPFFVSNCDIIVNCDYLEIYQFYKKAKFDLTLVSSMQHHIVPYGVCKLESDGSLESIREKPEYDFLVNTGMYILNPDILQFIPEDKSFDMTDLIKCLKEKKRKIGVFPVSEKSWVDIGQWEEYRKAISMLKI